MKRALISVSDKEGIVEFAKALIDLDFEIVSTGGTLKVLKDNGLEVLGISEVTGFPEILEGRVKTLHPNVHGGILAKNSKEHMEVLKKEKISPIDLVVVNLYPFKETIKKENISLEEAIENIDIGGPTMVRAAAKNFSRVSIVVRQENYGKVLEELRENGEISLDFRKKLALEAFEHTANYDASISTYLNQEFNPNTLPETYSLSGEKIMDLRYGENPHQKAAFYAFDKAKAGTIASARQLHGKELSYNNIVDLESAWNIVKSFCPKQSTACIIKHTNPCGAAMGKNLLEAYQKALAGDPISAFGGIIGLNQVVDEKTALEIKKTFMEAVIAPDFSKEALEILSSKKNLRLLAMGKADAENELWLEKVSGGFLLQEANSEFGLDDLECVTAKKPSKEELKELFFAWKIVKQVKSNAIVVTKNNQTVGVGAGQMNRVGSAKIAFEQAGEKCLGAVLASDAFFPFRDTIDEAAKAGIKAVIQPGGSIRDQESIDACNEHGITMVFTKMRHFKH